MLGRAEMDQIVSKVTDSIELLINLRETIC